MPRHSLARQKAQLRHPSTHVLSRAAAALVHCRLEGIRVHSLKISDQHKRACWEQSGVWLQKWASKRSEEMKKQQEILAQDHLQERRKLLNHLLYHENRMFEKELLQMGFVILK
ncbi:hypothetical protein NPIL_437161 [Nephila pilipes]|uniref:Uncharacterized protein n=1 Tax=Nephila pilipes TaxID=299642 RepID=A0A8X6Q7I4_NEPPI|nr:hypothetical protein NPIL_437161 [Nephila pilipes]